MKAISMLAALAAVFVGTTTSCLAKQSDWAVRHQIRDLDRQILEERREIAEDRRHRDWDKLRHDRDELESMIAQRNDLRMELTPERHYYRRYDRWYDPW